MFGARLLEGKQRVSPFCRDLHLLLKLGSDLHERNVGESFAHSKQRVCPFYRVSQLLHDKNVFSISCERRAPL